MNYAAGEEILHILNRAGPGQATKLDHKAFTSLRAQHHGHLTGQTSNKPSCCFLWLKEQGGMPTAGDTPGRCELSADGSRADVYFHQASAVYSQGPQFHPTLKNAEGSGETPGASPVVNLKLKLPGCEYVSARLKRQPPGARRSDFGGKRNRGPGRGAPGAHGHRNQEQEFAPPSPAAPTASVSPAASNAGPQGAPSRAWAGSTAASGAERAARGGASGRRKGGSGRRTAHPDPRGWGWG